jgi:MFS family permease
VQLQVGNGDEVLERRLGVINGPAVVWLIFARIIYAVNWFNMGSVFSALAVDFNEGVTGLGYLTGVLYLSSGLFQIPSGIVAAKIGPRNTAIYGTMMTSFAVLLTGLAATFYYIVLLRFIVGIGMALSFAPGVMLIAKYFEKRSKGFAVGLFTSAFNLGGALGIFGWAIFAEMIGWRLSLMASGALGVASGLLLMLVPKDALRDDFSIKASDLRGVLSDKRLILLGLALFPMTGGQSLISGFMVYYLEISIGTGGTVAGFIGGLMLIFALLASPIFGRIYDKTGNITKLLLFLGVTMASGIAVASIGTMVSATLSAMLVGLSFGASLTVIFSAAREANTFGQEYETLAVGWVNAIQISAGFLLPIFFSFYADHLGYPAAWLFSGLFIILLISSALLATIKVKS